jgi:hypothetical protein
VVSEESEDHFEPWVVLAQDGMHLGYKKYTSVLAMAVCTVAAVLTFYSRSSCSYCCYSMFIISGHVLKFKEIFTVLIKFSIFFLQCFTKLL